jgi:hypothetical protein
MSILLQPVHFPDADNDYVINDQTSLRSNFAISPFYYIKLESVDGFYGSDISTENHPVPHNIGERSGDSFRRGKGLALSGWIEGRNVIDLDTAANYLQEMFWNTYPRQLRWYIDTTQVYYLCRMVNDVSVVPSFDSQHPKWGWTVGLRADDPRPRKVSDDTLFYSWMS